MIAIEHATTGERQYVSSLSGYDGDWSQVGPALPPDVDLARIVLDGGEWVESLAICRDERWEEIKAARDRAQLGGCATPLGRVDTDAASQLKITGAVQMAMIAQAAGQPFSIEWTMQDNAAVTHDASAMIAMGLSVGEHIATCHQAALDKRAAVEAASDSAAIAAVNVASGWPA